MNMPEKQGPAALGGANRAGNQEAGLPIDTTIVLRARSGTAEPTFYMACAVAAGGRLRRFVSTEPRWHRKLPGRALVLILTGRELTPIQNWHLHEVHETAITLALTTRAVRPLLFVRMVAPDGSGAVWGLDDITRAESAAWRTAVSA
jgi:hypothetical protein